MIKYGLFGFILMCSINHVVNASLIGEKSYELIFDPNNADAKSIQLVIEGMQEMNDGNFRQANSRFRQAAILNEKDPIPLLALAKLAILEDKPNTAHRHLEKALDLTPESAEVHASLGRFYASRNKNTQAELFMNNAIELKPNAIGVLTDLGFLYLNTLRVPEKARATFEQATKYAPDHAESHYGLALSLANMGKYQEAESAFIVVTTLLPEDATAFQALGRLYAQQQKYDLSLSALEQAITLNRQFVPLYMDKADVLAAKGNLDQAISSYQYAANLMPSSALPLLRLGALYERSDQKAEAVRVYKKAIALEPQQAIAYNAIAWLYKDEPGKRNEAMAFANKAVDLSNGEPMFIDTLAWLHKTEGSLIESERLLKVAVAKKQPPISLLFYHLGLVQHQLNKSVEALSALNKALEIDSDFEYAAESKALIESIVNQLRPE